MKELDRLEKEIINILNTLEDCDDAYYVEGKNLVPDDVYDQLRRELIATPVYVDAIRRMGEDDTFDDYHTTIHRYKAMVRKIGTTKIKKPTVKREQKMLSLQNAFNAQEAQAFMASIAKKALTSTGSEKVKMLYMSKYDGISIELIYTYGELSQISTRGNGSIGDDITHMYPLFTNLPDSISSLNEHERRVIRGEALITRAHFDALNELRVQQGKEVYISTRSAVAGRLNASMPENEEIPIFFVAFEDMNQIATETMTANFKLLEKYGFLTPTRDMFSWDYSLSNWNTVIEKFENNRPWHVFDTDGVVIAVDSLKLRNELGASVKTPNYAFAYKFEPSSAATVIESIETTVGRTGIVTPVANLRPVVLNGITYKRANLHDFANIIRKDIRIGDAVIVERAGDVIPDIRSVILSLRNDLTPKYTPPTHCPSCGNALDVLNNFSTVVCRNTRCGSQTHNRLINAAYRNALNLKGLGPAAIEDLIAAYGFENAADLLSITDSHLTTLFGETSPKVKTISDSLQDAIAVIKSSVQGLGRLIFALSIPEVGKATADNLAAHFGSLSKLRAATEQDLKLVKEVGAEKSGLIIGWFLVPENAELIERLISMGYDGNHEPVDNLLQDSLIVVFTGVFDTGSRDVMETMAMDRGYAVSKRVTRKTNLVVYGDKPGNALSEAARLDIPTANELQWLESIGVDHGQLKEW